MKKQVCVYFSNAESACLFACCGEEGGERETGYGNLVVILGNYTYRFFLISSVLVMVS